MSDQRCFRAVDWKRFQHYRYRRPPWIKLHRDVIESYEFQCLPVASKALAPQLWLLASESGDGSIPLDSTRLAFRLRMDESELADALNPLIENGFFECASGVALAALAASAQLATPESRAKSTHKEKPSAGRSRQRSQPESDHRHGPIRVAIKRAQQAAGQLEQWGPRDAKALAALLEATPGNAVELIANRFASDEPLGDPPYTWLPRLLKFSEGPLNRHNRVWRMDRPSEGITRAVS